MEIQVFNSLYKLHLFIKVSSQEKKNEKKEAEIKKVFDKLNNRNFIPLILKWEENG